MISQQSINVRSNSKYLYPAISIFIPTLIFIFFVLNSDQMYHWFIFPTLACGIIAANDMVLWFRGKYDMFDPIGLIGFLAFHLFFLAPLLSVYWDFWMNLVTHPDDWRTWIGGMSILNFVGYICYRFTAINFSNKPFTNKNKRVIAPRRMKALLWWGVGIGLAAQMYFYKKMGGFVYFLTTDVSDRKSLLSGSGLLLTFSECSPILLVFLLVLKNKKKKKTTFALAIILLGLFIAKLFFGGLRGSRNSTIWFLFWVVVIIHQYMRPIKQKHVILGVIFMSLFMYAYGFYKSAGVEGLASILNPKARQAIASENYNRTYQYLLLRDYGRSDVQALLLERLNNSSYKLAWGKSYIGDLSVAVPDVLLAGMESKRHYGTRLMYADRGLPSSSYLSSNLYGLSGEWMMNFGYVTLPLAFIIMGVVVGKVRRFYLYWDKDDARRLLIPLFINASFLILVNDFDNDILFVFRNGLVAIIIIYLGSNKVKMLNDRAIS